MKIIHTNERLWISGNNSEILAHLRRLMIHHGQDAKVSDVLRKNLKTKHL